MRLLTDLNRVSFWYTQLPLTVPGMLLPFRNGESQSLPSLFTDDIIKYFVAR